MGLHGQWYDWRTYFIEMSFYDAFLRLDCNETEMLSAILCRAGGREGEARLPVLIRRFPENDWTRVLSEMETSEARKPSVYIGVSEKYCIHSLAFGWCKGLETFPTKINCFKTLERLYLTHIGLKPESLRILKENYYGRGLYLGATELASLGDREDEVLAELTELEVSFGREISPAWNNGAETAENGKRPGILAAISGLLGAIG